MLKVKGRPQTENLNSIYREIYYISKGVSDTKMNPSHTRRHLQLSVTCRQSEGLREK